MGSYSLLQIVGSTIIGGLFLLGLFRYNAVMVEKKHRFDAQNITQNNLTEVTNLINLDFNKIGYCLDKNIALQIFENPITEATDTTFAFQTDVPVDTTNPYGDGSVDILRYYLGGPVPSTSNPFDRKLFRSINGGSPLELNYGITGLKFTYYDASGNKLLTPVANLKSISVIEYRISIEDIYGYNYTYITPDSTDSKQGDSFFISMTKTNKIAIRNLKRR